MKKWIINVCVILVVIILTSSITYLIMDYKYKNLENNNGEINLDSITEPKNETIILEGMEEVITTVKYTSSLGYSLRYDIENFNVNKENGKDKFVTINPDVYLTINVSNINYETFIEDFKDYKITHINGNTAIEKDNYIYVKGNNKTYIIEINYPQTSEYIEGWGSRISQMLNNSFEIIE